MKQYYVFTDLGYWIKIGFDLYLLWARVFDQYEIDPACLEGCKLAVIEPAPAADGGNDA